MDSRNLTFSSLPFQPWNLEKASEIFENNAVLAVILASASTTQDFMRFVLVYIHFSTFSKVIGASVGPSRFSVGSKFSIENEITAC